nr:MAG TPA: hypothetical protein [Caudoviricetes sp.]
MSLGSEKLAKKSKTKIIKHAGLVFDANPLRMCHLGNRRI